MQKKIRRLIEQVIFFCLLIGLWELITYLGIYVFHWWKSYNIPTPLGVLESAKNLFQANLISAIVNSLGRCILGFGIAIVIGTIFGMLIHRIQFLKRNLKPLILGVQTLPSICWVPFAILWFGLDGSAIIFVVIMGSAFSLSLAIDGAISNINPIYLKVSRTLGATSFDQYTKVVLPAALPGLVSGLKQTWSFAWRALMSGEVMVSCVGLGYTLQYGRELGDINQVALVMIIIVILGVIIDKFVFSLIEGHILRKRGL